MLQYHDPKLEDMESRPWNRQILDQGDNAYRSKNNPKQHFSEKCAFQLKLLHACIFLQISLKLVSNGPIDNKLSVVQWLGGDQAKYICSSTPRWDTEKCQQWY